LSHIDPNSGHPETIKQFKRASFFGQEFELDESSDQLMETTEKADEEVAAHSLRKDNLNASGLQLFLEMKQSAARSKT